MGATCFVAVSIFVFPNKSSLCQSTVMMVFTPQTKEGSCFTQEESNTLSLRTAAVSRRHSADGMISSWSGRGGVDTDRFHPYQRQFSDGAVAGCLQQCSSSFSSLHEVCSPGSHSHSSNMPPSWDQYNGSIQVSILMIHSFYPSILIKVCTAKSSLIDLTQEYRQAKKRKRSTTSQQKTLS